MEQEFALWMIYFPIEFGFTWSTCFRMESEPKSYEELSDKHQKKLIQKALASKFGQRQFVQFVFVRYSIYYHGGGRI